MSMPMTVPPLPQLKYDPLAHMPKRYDKPTLLDILQASALAHGIHHRQAMKAPSRSDINHARWVYFTLARENTKHSMAKIGSFVDRKHNAVLNGLRKAKTHHPNYAVRRATAVAILKTQFPNLDWREF